MSLRLRFGLSSRVSASFSLEFPSDNLINKENNSFTKTQIGHKNKIALFNPTELKKIF